MNKPISTKVHGVLDYLTAPTLFTLPRVMGWGKKTTTLLTGAALGLLGYSVLTRYELGLIRVLPMPGHLALDMASGGMLLAAPFTLLDKHERSGPVTAALVGFGVFEVAASLLTQTQPASDESLQDVLIPHREKTPVYA